MANLNSIGSRNYLHLEPTADEEKTIRDQAIKDVALGCFLELAVSSALAAFCCCFVATPAAVATIANGLAIQTLASFVMRCHVGLAKYQNQTHPNVVNTREDEHTLLLVKWLGAYSFATQAANNAQVVVHEAGHALAIKALLKNANPKITLFPYTGAVTSWGSMKELTDLGKKIGQENIRPIIAGAGPFLTLTLSTVMLGAGLASQDAAPEVSRMLIVSALVDFLTHIIYALSALTASLTDLSHDFVALWQLGNIHPLAAAVAIAAVPIFVLAAYFAIKKST